MFFSCKNFQIEGKRSLDNLVNFLETGGFSPPAQEKDEL
jgi:hypothetical protein